MLVVQEPLCTRTPFRGAVTEGGGWWHVGGSWACPPPPARQLGPVWRDEVYAEGRAQPLGEWDILHPLPLYPPTPLPCPRRPQGTPACCVSLHAFFTMPEPLLGPLIGAPCPPCLVGDRENRMQRCQIGRPSSIPASFLPFVCGAVLPQHSPLTLQTTWERLWGWKSARCKQASLTQAH